MSKPIVVIGAGIGGLTAAALLARNGKQVVVLEARDGPGGLASSFQVKGLTFDGGPYILLDRAGLEWTFGQLGEDLSAHVSLKRIDEVYQVQLENGPTVEIFGSLDRTIEGLSRLWPGVTDKYRRFADDMLAIYHRLQPLQYASRPGLGGLLACGAWREIPFLLRPLSSILNSYRFPKELVQALGIWTHVAGQPLDEAPSPLAFVPALIHGPGAYFPKGGVGTIAHALESIGREAGVEFRYGSTVSKILHDGRRITGVDVNGQALAADSVVSNAGGIATYLELLDGVSSTFQKKLSSLPLQSPGVCAYLSAKGPPASPYLKFYLPEKGSCRLLIQPGFVDSDLAGTARLLGPMGHRWAAEAGAAGQSAYLEKLLEEDWWKEPGLDAEVIARKTPVMWGREFHLYRDSMNPVMTSKFMRQGRIAHKGRFVNGLCLAGSSTHPGQWVSFCAVSGILAARERLC